MLLSTRNLFFKIGMVIILTGCGGGAVMSGFDTTTIKDSEEISDVQDTGSKDQFEDRDIQRDDASGNLNKDISDVDVVDTTDSQKDTQLDQGDTVIDTEDADSDINVVTCSNDSDCTGAISDLGVCEEAICKDGKCVRATKQCNTPPADECKDERTLITYHKDGKCDQNTGECVYSEEVVECKLGCVDGACIGKVGLLDGKLIPAGPTVMSTGDYTLRAKLTSWYEGVEVSDDNNVLIP